MSCSMHLSRSGVSLFPCLSLILSCGLFMHIHAITMNVPDDRCPEGDTCCRLAEGEFGCCRGENAVCCDDHGKYHRCIADQ